VLELDSGLEFNPEHDEGFFALLPERPAVCLIEAHEEKAEPYLIRTANLRSRLQRLLGPLDLTSKRLNLREFARLVRYRVTNSAFEQSLTFYQIARQRFPKRYRDLMRLRPSPVLKINLKNAYPRCYVTRHIAVNEQGVPTGGIYYGPFASRRAAQMYADSVLDFFKVRRCQIKIRRDPSFPGCLYSEMKMCLAPCFAGCSKEEYDVEVNRLVGFLETGGGSLRATYEQERERASEELDFERAAAIHKKLEKLDDALRAGPEVARRVIRLFRQFRPPQRAEYHLSQQETEVLKLLVDGHHYKTAAKKLGISVNTVSFHLRNIYAKLEVHSKSEAVAKALRKGLV